MVQNLSGISAQGEHYQYTHAHNNATFSEGLLNITSSPATVKVN